MMDESSEAHPLPEPDPLLDAIRRRLRPLPAPEGLRARIAAMLAAEREAGR